MANNNHPHDNLSDPAPTDDFFEQILGISNFSGSSGSGLSGLSGGLGGVGPPPMMLQLGSGDDGNHNHMGAIGGGGPVGFHNQMFPLGLSLDQGKGHGFLKPEGVHGSGKRFQDDVVDNRCSSMKPVSFLKSSVFFCGFREKRSEIKSLGFQKGNLLTFLKEEKKPSYES